MTTKYRQPGDVIDVTTAGAVTVGALVKLSHTIGLALRGAAGAGEVISVAIAGVFEVPKVAGTAWAQGEKLVYKTGTNSFNGSGTAVVSGDVTGAAVAAAPAASGDTVAYAMFTPGNATLTP
jgi:predicted RecA/RadA family phage recombinase